MVTTQKTGQTGESLALEIIQQAGLQIVTTNYRAGKLGEMDIIAKQDDLLVFIEVKTRHSTQQGLPEEAISPNKLRKLGLVAQHYLKTHQLHNQAFRIDLLALGLDHNDQIIYQNWLPNISF